MWKKRLTWWGLGVLLAFLAGAPTSAAPKFGTVADRIHLEFDVLPQDPFSEANKPGAAQSFKPGEVVRLVIKGAPQGGYHTYAVNKHTRNHEVTELVVDKTEVFEPLRPVLESEPQLEAIPGVGSVWQHGKPFVWGQDVYISPTAKPGAANLHFTLDITACDAKTCLPPETLSFDAPVTIADGPPLPPPPDLETRQKQKQPEPVLTDDKGNVVKDVPGPVAPPPNKTPTPDPGGDKTTKATPPPPARGDDGFMGVLMFMGQGALWGFISLLTPCVFPMIPITVSFFLKQAESRASATVPPAASSPSSGIQSGPAVAVVAPPGQTIDVRKKVHSPLTLAMVYSGTIILVLTVSTIGLLSVFQAVSTHWATNLLLGGLFVFFALSLFGMYDIELPSFLAAFTSKNESRGGLVGTMFMALTFTIISFACVAPFLGGFGGTAAANGSLPWNYRVGGGLAFAAAFASPFFILALFPALLKKLPKSGAWLNSVKVVMGFLELAAAVKFLRAGELLYFPAPVFFTYDLSLGIYIALSLACGLYLLNVYRLPHDTPINNLGVPRLLFSIAFLSLGLYLMPALFKVNVQGDSQRPGGIVFAWLDSFLLPDSTALGPNNAVAKNEPGAIPEPTYTIDLQDALKRAYAKRGLVFVDFTGTNCTNCRLNERNVFSRADVKEVLNRYTLAKLYTDIVPGGYYPAGDPGYSRRKADADANKELESRRFDSITLPYYAVLRPLSDKEGDFEIIGKYEKGTINDISEFKKFLTDPLPADSAGVRTAAKGG
jgi:thiol:disulfide interchange protein DsbD